MSKPGMFDDKVSIIEGNRVAFEQSMAGILSPDIVRQER